LPTLPLGDSEALRVGEWVIAIGNPLEFDQTVTVGVVSGKERRVPLRSTDRAIVSFIQTDAAINFGNSGGPLLDARGNVVGINTAINRQFLAEGIGFALPINQARAVVDQLMARGFVRRGFLGITMNDLPLDEAAQEFYGLPDANGVIISNVTEDGPGDRAGLKPGDIIRRVDGKVVGDNFDLVSKIASRQPGEQVALEVFRKPTGADVGRSLDLTVTLADRDHSMTEIGGADRRSPRGAEPEPELREAEGLGLTVESLTERLREQHGLRADQTGVLVTDVEFGSRAADKGLQPNLIITAINDQAVHDVADWSRLLGKLKPGASVKLDVFDGRQTSYVFLRAPEE
jgi:serine protease Do